MEGQIKLYAVVTPTYERFETITIGAVASYGADGRNVMSMEKEVSVEEAREFIAQIQRCIEGVEADR